MGSSTRNPNRRALATIATALVALALVVSGVVLWQAAQVRSGSHAASFTGAMPDGGGSTQVASSRPGRPPTSPANPRTARERLLAAAHGLLGTPYRYGTNAPEALDCGAFTQRAYEAVGVRLPDRAAAQAIGEQPLDDHRLLRPGDLIFYRWPGAEGVTHVTMYAGDGWVIGAGTPGQPRCVCLYPLHHDLRDDGRVLTYRRIKLRDE